MKKRMTRAFVKSEVARIEGAKEPSAEGIFLLSSIVKRPSADGIHRWIGKGLFSRAKAREMAMRCRQNHIWVGRKVAASEWLEKGGGIAFNLDVAVVMGLLQRQSA